MASSAVTEFQEAVKQGDASIFKFYLQRIGHRLDYIDSRDSDGYTALHHSCLNSNIGFVRNLVDIGADLEIKSEKENWTALHCACLSANKAIVLFLLNSFANPFVIDRYGKFPIDLDIDSETKELISKHMSVDSRKDSLRDNESAVTMHTCNESHCDMTKL